MTLGGPLVFATAVLWREARASRGKFALAVLLMAAATASAFGVRSVTAGLTNNVLNNAREWIAADVMAVYFGRAPTPEQWGAVGHLGRGLDYTMVTEMPVLASSDQAPDPVLTAAKVVNPAAYPYYGHLEVQTGRALGAILDANSIVVSSDVLESLHVPVGGTVRISQTEFRIVDIIAAEPDRYAVPPVPIGRVIISQEAMDRTGLMQFGAVGYYRILLRTSRAADRHVLCSRLEGIFPGAKVIDYTSRTPVTAAIVEWVVPFLNMIGFLAIAVGSIGIGAAAHFHLLRSMDTVAILKSLGATTERIMSVYLLQVVCLASTGIVLGVASGGLVEVLLGKLAIGYLGAQIDGANRVAVALETAIFSLLVASVAAWVPLSRIRFIPAAVLLRRDTGEKLQLQRSIAERIRFRPTVLLVVLGIAALVIFQPGESWRGRAFLLLGIGVGVSAVYAISQASIAALFHIIRARGQNLPWSVRQGIGNLHRYHRQARTVIVALASAVAFIVIALLAGRHLQAYILDAIPFHTPNLLFIYVDETRKAELSEVLAHQPGVEGRPQFIPTAWVALSRAGNSTLETLRAGRPQTWIPRDWPASCSDSKPPSVDVVAGQWWSPGTPDNNVALSEDLAELFGVHVGSRMDFVVGRRPIQARLGALLRIPPAQRAWWREIVFNCQVLPRALYSGAITIAPEHLDDVRQSLHERFPEVILLDINDLLQRTERIGAQALRILSIIGVVAAFLAGCLLLAVIGSVRAFRVYDIAIMRALGARKSTLLAPLAMEYLALGGLAGLFGGVLGCLATSLILRQAAGILIWTLDPYAIAIATIGGAALAALFGLLGSITLLQPKPLEILRRH